MISIIIVTYDRKLLLKECLESILSKKTNENIEIIVIDNHSNDGTKNYIKNIFGDRVRILKNEMRLSLSASKALGVKSADSDIVAFIDDDCLASKDWISEIKKSLIGYDFVGGRVLPTANVRFPWWWRRSLDWLIGINTAPCKKYLPLGSNVAFNKYVLDALQKTQQDAVAEPNLYLPYAEDNYRTKKSLDLGYSMAINKNMIVYHQISTKRLRISYLLKRSYNEGRALVNYKKKSSDLLFSFFVLPYNFVKLFISLDINLIFRMISHASYIFNYIKIKLNNKD